jgi:NAD(P)-dependent dehydrogenase (short-subunit alcohol dehydrogenase family)
MTTKDQKIILLTGVTHGLGKALALRFIEHGHIIAGCGRTASEIDRLSTDYPDSFFKVVDIANFEAVQRWGKETIENVGCPDLLINCAGILNVPAELWEIPSDEFEQVIKINIIGSWNVIRSLVPCMIQKHSGVIVNFSSGLGHHGSALVGPYCASKFAIEGMSQSLAQELPKGMAAVAFSPGVINTAMLRKYLSESANTAELPDTWSKRVAPFLLQLGQKDNGKSLEAP